MREFLRAMGTGIRLCCPRCRREPLFSGLFRMREACPLCGWLVEREAGYFVGAIYINYAATVALCLSGYFFLEWLASPPLWAQLALWSAVGAAFPLLFFRYSRSLWLSLDYFISPPPASTHAGGRERSRSTP